MHNWLAAELMEVEKLVAAAMPGQRTSSAGLAAAEALRQRLQSLVTLLSGGPGIATAFVAADGLVLAAHGAAVPTSHDDMAAIAQRVTGTAMDSARMGAFGSVGQLVIVCDEWKIALIPVGVIVVGIVCRATVALASALQAVSPQQLTEPTVVRAPLPRPQRHS